MKPRVYLETTIVSYLAARPSRDLVVAANQEVTRQWWDQRSGAFELFVSQLVAEESAAGDAAAAQRRLDILAKIPQLDLTREVAALARQLIADVPLPLKARADAVHIAAAAVHGMDYLVTWNCTHIANATLRGRIESACRAAGCQPPVICTPQELLEWEDDDA